MLMTYPRFVHAEHMRHRMCSYCVASSRAIPTARFRALVELTPAMPVWWGKNQPGMQAHEELDGTKLMVAQSLWEEAKGKMILIHKALEDLGLHKSICNRILEPWMPVTVLVTATDWKNFFGLRCHADAQKEMQAAADTALYAYVNSTPQLVNAGDWHMPFIRQEELGNNQPLLQTVSAARCARLSYLNLEGKSLTEEVKLADKLINAGHWSPFEQVAKAMNTRDYYGNFQGWMQLRKMFPMENKYQIDLDLPKLLKKRQDEGSRFAWATGE